MRGQFLQHFDYWYDKFNDAQNANWWTIVISKDIFFAAAFEFPAVN